MTVERAYRREGLTIGSLARAHAPAAISAAPNHQRRSRPSQFQCFSNPYRIDEAKTALANSGQKDVPVLTIAMDAGFRSLGPFNRAFKADTALTPTSSRSRSHCVASETWRNP